MRYSGWMRLRIAPDADPARVNQLIPYARVMIGQLLLQIKLVDQATGVLRRRLPDGSVVVVRFDGTTPMAEISTPPVPAQQEEDNSNLWVPRGFVVYPAWKAHPFGVGLPIVKDGDHGSYDPANLAPGLDRSRWTAGGPCGEVLISRDVEAGYPNRTAVPAPIMFDPRFGPRPLWVSDSGTYDNRPARGAWKSYRLECQQYLARDSGQVPADQQAMLEAINAARPMAATPRLRGFECPAEVMANIMASSGSTDETAAGYPPGYKTLQERLTKEGYSIDIAGQAFGSFDRSLTWKAYEFRADGDAASAVTGWLQDPTTGPHVIEDMGASAFLDTGSVGQHYCAVLTRRDRWIQAGNMSWQHQDASLPALSWHGFASLNLSWETYPTQFNLFSGDNGGQRLRWFLARPPSPLAQAMTDANGDHWLRYPRGADYDVTTSEPAMGRHIYCRGRSIALAPDGGLIWGATVIPGSSADRLIALVHHAADQPADQQTDGTCRYLRVWWADIPRRNRLRIAPQQVICGTDVADPWGWRGGTQVDVGALGGTGAVDSLAYKSQWRFSPDGRRAACLRYKGTLADASDNQVTWGAYLVELVMTSSADAVTVATSGTALALSDPTSFVGSPAFTGWDALAVDYDAAGQLVLAVDVLSSHAGTGPVYYTGSATLSAGALGAPRHPVVQTLQPTTAALPGAGTPRWFRSHLVVADVLDSAFAVAGRSLPEVTGYDGEDGRRYSYYTPQQWTRSASITWDVAAYRRGEQVGELPFSGDSRLMLFGFTELYIDDTAAYSVNTWYAPELRSMSALMQVHYARRGGDYVFAVQVAPMPACMLVSGATPSPDSNGSFIVGLLDNAAVSTTADLAPAGGIATASVPLPDNDWLIFAKVA